MSILIALKGALRPVKALSHTLAHSQHAHGWLHPEWECNEVLLPSLSIKGFRFFGGLSIKKN